MFHGKIVEVHGKNLIELNENIKMYPRALWKQVGGLHKTKSGYVLTMVRL